MAPQTLAPETVIGSRFKVEQQLGSGGLGALYRAVDRESGEPVALRVLASDISRSEVAIEQLRGQIRLASKLAHKNVARVFGMGKQGSIRYLACEFIDGHSLRDIIERKRHNGQVFSLKSAYNVVAHVCSALRAALQLELTPPLFHGLPAPGSIRINRAGRVKLCDFGILQALPAGSAALARLGDHYCVAPEMEISPATSTPASDIYTLGVVLYEMLSGHPPSSPYTPLSELVPTISGQTDELIKRCLQTDPSVRFAAPEQLKLAVYEALQSMREEEQSSPSAASSPSVATPEGEQSAAAVAAELPAHQINLASTVDLAPAAQPSPQTPAAQPSPQTPAAQPSPQAPILTPQADTGRRAVEGQPDRRSAIGPVGAGSTGPQRVHPGRAPAPAPAAPFVPAPAAAAPAPAPAFALAPTATAASAPAPPRIEDLLTAPIPDDDERWLVHKQGLDFGPFTLGEVKQQLFKGDFGGDEEMIDQDSRERVLVSRHPALAEFVRALQVHRQNEQVERSKADSLRRAKRRRAFVLTALSLCLAAIAVSGVVFYWLTRNPEVIEKRVEVPGEAKLSLDITWKNEPKEQAAKRKALRRRRRKKRGKVRQKQGAAADEQHVTYLGDASKAGGDELLSQQQIQTVMERNVQKLARCVLQQARRDSSLSRVAIDFGVKGTGTVSYVKVNGQREGPFQACVQRSMRQISFPKYDGSLTRASFAMNLNR